MLLIFFFAIFSSFLLAETSRCSNLTAIQMKAEGFGTQSLALLQQKLFGTAKNRLNIRHLIGAHNACFEEI